MKELIVRPGWDAGKVSVSVTLDGREHRLGFAISGDEPRKQEDFLIPLTLFPAMLTRCSRLQLPGKVSPRLLSAIPRIEDIFRLWGDEYWGEHFKNLERVPVEAEARTEPAEQHMQRRAAGVACFFSGGVDSFYTLLKHREEVTHIIFVHGFDIALENEAVRNQASVMAREVARALGKAIIEVEADISPFPRRLVGWDKYHGAAMASIALLFQQRFRKVLFAATNTYAELTPWGTHPMLDPLWSTYKTEIEHDGGEATRFEKVAYISEEDLAMRWLRVCLKNPGGVYNCGRCVKCLRTRIALQTVGALERCATLPDEVDLQEVADMELSSDPERFVVRQTVETLRRLGGQPELAKTLAERLDEDERAQEISAGHAQRQRLQRQLSLTQARLERTRARLEALRTRNKGLAQRNRLLTARYSGRRYRLADAFVSIVLRLPGLGWLLRRRGAAD